MERIDGFIPYEQALELKDLGFDEPCLGMYRKKNRMYLLQEPKRVNSEKESVISAPLFQEVFKWFRETHGLESFVYYDDSYGFYGCKFYGNDERDNIHGQFKNFETHPEAELACVKELIKFVKNK